MIRKTRVILIALLGIDGSGKTTQSRLLKKALTKAGFPCILTKPYILIQSILPKVLKKFSSKFVYKETSLIPTVIKKRNTIRKIIKSFYILSFLTLSLALWILQRGKTKIIIMDRYGYYFAFLALPKRIALKIACLIPKPSLLFLLHGNPNNFVRRQHQIWDTQLPMEYYSALQSFYRSLVIYLNGITINVNNKSIQEIHDLILGITLKKLEGWYHHEYFDDRT